MPTGQSITHWIHQIKDGDPAAADELWQRYFTKLVRIARQKLGAPPCRMADEEDVALSAFDSFCRAARRGRFPDLADRDGLWRLLLEMTARKAVDQLRCDARQRRGGGRVRGESAFDARKSVGGQRGSSNAGRGIERHADSEPTPVEAAVLGEECRRLLDLLDDPALQALAIAKMEGYTNDEIAERQCCSRRTVERRLQLIRRKWIQERRE